MLQIMNSRQVGLSHSGGPNNENVGIVVNYWENARPLIKELEQTVDFAERKYGDLMQQLNLCKEYYERWSTEKFGEQANKRKLKKRILCRESSGTRSSSENESGKESWQRKQGYTFNERLKNKIYEIAKEIKEANKKICLKASHFGKDTKFEADAAKCLAATPQNVFTLDVPKEEKDIIPNHLTKSEPVIGTVGKMLDSDQAQDKTGQKVKNILSKTLHRKKVPVVVKTMQKYKLRSKSLPQGVRRKFGFGSFVEIVEKQGPKFSNGLVKIKSRTTVSSGSKSNHGKERGDGRKSRPKERIFDKRETSDPNKSSAEDVNRPLNPKSYKEPGIPSQTNFNLCEQPLENNHPSICSLGNDLNLGQRNDQSTSSTVGNDSKMVKADTLAVGKHKSLTVATRQPIPFTICRTAKTFNLGLNIQQVLSMIKNKRHSSMLQALIKDNIQTARSVIRKTEPNIKTLFIASSRMTGNETDACPAREYGDTRCYSIVSSTVDTNSSCNMLSCARSVNTNYAKENLNVETPQMKYDVQRPEDVWVVEQPDSHQPFQRFPNRCTCFPTKQSVDYDKVISQYSRLNRQDHKAEGFVPRSLCSSEFPARILLCDSGLRSLPSRHQITYNDSAVGTKLEMRKVQDDLDNLSRRYKYVQEYIAYRKMDEHQADRELVALENELNYREQDCRCIMNFYNQLIELKKKITDLREKVKGSTSLQESNSRLARSRRDPFKPTPSMTLTRVLRQIQCLQDKIKLIDSPLVT